ncbi:MAG: amidohydrolase family protein, partial [Leptospira sp.]|nr:amidohydrolase family protein [Leptospira sp.]
MKPHREWELANGCIVGPKILRRNYSVQVAGTKISTVTETTLTPGKLRLNLKGLPVYPGLFNSYDHLLGTYLPKVGVNRPYLNWLPWDNDLKSSPVFAERQQLEPEQLYYLGCYRHLISGVTSVMDHIPHFVQEPFIGSMPIRILSNYNLAHSLCSFSLNWGDGPKKEYEDAKKNNRPFVIQISEGFDPETADSLKNLHALGALGEHTVLVHGLSFTNEDIRLVKESGASLVWCPSSNLFIFNKTVDIKSVLDAGINVCLGTDTSMSGSLNIFEEIRTAREHYRNEYGEELEPKKIFQMLTVNPA